MTKTERIEEFSDLLTDAMHHSKTSRKHWIEIFELALILTGVRHRKSTVDEEEDGVAAKQSIPKPVVVPEVNEEANSIRKPVAFTQNGEDEQVPKKKRAKKVKTEPIDDASAPTVSFSAFKYVIRAFF